MATITGNVSWSIYIVPQDFFFNSLVSLRVLSLSIYLYHFFSKTIQQGADPDIFQGGGEGLRWNLVVWSTCALKWYFSVDKDFMGVRGPGRILWKFLDLKKISSITKPLSVDWCFFNRPSDKLLLFKVCYLI